MRRFQQPTFASPFVGTPSVAITEENSTGSASKLLKLTLHSSNNTDPGSNQTSDFTVAVTNPALAKLNVTKLAVSDVVFPGGQYTIERAWSRLDYNEGIVPSDLFRNLTVTWPDGPDHVVEMRGLLPLRTNLITSVAVEDAAANTYRFKTAQPFGSSISALQTLLGNSLAMHGVRFRANGVQPLSKDAGVAVAPVRRLSSSHVASGASLQDVMETEFVAQLNVDVQAELASLNPVIDSTTFGFLTTTNFASPADLAVAATTMLNAATPMRKLASTSTGTGTTAVAAGAPLFTFTITWDPLDDRYSITYALVGVGAPPAQSQMPVLTGDVFVYMGFKVPLQLPALADGYRTATVAAQGTRSADVASGTRVQPGHYVLGADLASAMSTALNGTWFGLPSQAANTPNPSGFALSLIAANGVRHVVPYCAGRYTPAELAFRFNAFFVGQSPPQPYRALPLFRDGIEFVGLKFFFQTDTTDALTFNDVALPFTLEFGSATTTLDPVRIGYEARSYTGATAYFPTTQPPWYPLLLQGNNAAVAVPASQHYRVAYTPRLERLGITTEPFAPSMGVVVSVDATAGTAVIQLPIAHGAPVGAHMYITRTTVGGVDPAVGADCGAAGVAYRAAQLAALQSGATAVPDTAAVAATVSAVVVPSTYLDDNTGNGQIPVGSHLSTAAVGALDPTELTVAFGGTFSSSDAGLVFAPGNLVLVTFTCPNIWSLDCSWGVADCIDRQVVGLDPVLYAFNRNYSFTRPEQNTPGATFVFGSDATAPRSVVTVDGGGGVSAGAASGFSAVVSGSRKQRTYILTSTMGFPSVPGGGVVYSDVTEFNFPHIVNLLPFKDVYLVLTVNRHPGDGNTYGIATTKSFVKGSSAGTGSGAGLGATTGSGASGVLTNGPTFTAIAHVLVGGKHSCGIVDLYDRLFEQKLTGVETLSTVRVQFVNPDMSLYNFHGRDAAVTLLLSVVDATVSTTH